MLIEGINEWGFRLINGMAGHSWALDSFVSIIENNDLAKGAIIGACFMAAWHRRLDLDDKLRVRRVLIATLLSCIITLLVTKTASHTIFYPRPYILSKTLYHLENGNLVEKSGVEFNLPLDETSGTIYENFLDGHITVNHLGTFPSDNAGFFIAISLGILFAYRMAGTIALGWTVLFILGAKIFTGKHFPLDIAAGAILAIIGFFSIKIVSEKPLRGLFERASRWTLKHDMLSSAIIFIVVFEIASTLDHLFPIFNYLAIIIRHILSG